MSNMFCQLLHWKSSQKFSVTKTKTKVFSRKISCFLHFNSRFVLKTTETALFSLQRFFDHLLLTIHILFCSLNVWLKKLVDESKNAHSKTIYIQTAQQKSWVHKGPFEVNQKIPRTRDQRAGLIGLTCDWKNEGLHILQSRSYNRLVMRVCEI